MSIYRSPTGWLATSSIPLGYLDSSELRSFRSIWPGLWVMVVDFGFQVWRLWLRYARLPSRCFEGHHARGGKHWYQNGAISQMSVKKLMTFAAVFWSRLALNIMK
jgi:hypothetical protein